MCVHAIAVVAKDHILCVGRSASIDTRVGVVELEFLFEQSTQLVTIYSACLCTFKYTIKYVNRPQHHRRSVVVGVYVCVCMCARWKMIAQPITLLRFRSKSVEPNRSSLVADYACICVWVLFHNQYS